MAAWKQSRCVAGVALAAALFLVSGCLTARQKSVLGRHPRNEVFKPDRDILALAPAETSYLREFDRAGAQNVCLLRLARDATFARRYHAEHDLTLVCVSGSAIVTVEETRHLVTPGGAVVLPRMTAYAILPHETESDFVALMVYSPPFRGKDTFLAK